MKKVYLTSFLIYSAWSAFVTALLASTPTTLVYITPKFSGIDTNKLIETLLLILFLSLINPLKLDNPFYLFFLGANFFIVIPLTTFRFCTSAFDTELINQTLSVILLGLFISRTVALLPNLNTTFVNSPRHELIQWKLRVITRTFAILSVIVIVTTAILFGVRSLSLEYSSIYKQRLDLRNVVSEGSFLGYALNNVEQLLLPALLVIGLYLKNWKTVFVSVSSTLVYFSFSGSRSSFAMLFLIIILFLLHNNKHKIRIISTTLSTLFSIFWTLVYVFRNTEFGSVFFDLLLRSVVVPGIGSIKYVQFFNSFGTTDFKQSRIIASILNEPPIPLTYILGNTFYNNSQQNFNSNIWCDAMISAGLVGVIGISICLGLCFLILRFLLNNQSPVWVFPLYGYVTLNFVEQSFLTAFLSSGFALSFILAYYLRPSHVRRQNSI